MKNHFKVFVFAAITLFLMTGCASIVSKSSYPVSITSDPDNASVIITDKSGREIFMGTTPMTITLNAGAGFFERAHYQVRFHKPGYNDAIIPVTFSIDGWYFGNLLLGGVIGMLIIDPATGAMWKLDTPYLHGKLYSQFASEELSLRIRDINDIPAEMRKHLVRIE